jgi:hypothetical protein
MGRETDLGFSADDAGYGSPQTLDQMGAFSSRSKPMTTRSGS